VNYSWIFLRYGLRNRKQTSLAAGRRGLCDAVVIRELTTRQVPI
jgi:hypothetical protein